jgi:hypothetical protein
MRRYSTTLARSTHPHRRTSRHQSAKLLNKTCAGFQSISELFREAALCAAGSHSDHLLHLADACEAIVPALRKTSSRQPLFPEFRDLAWERNPD